MTSLSNVVRLGCSNAAVTYFSDRGGFDLDEREEDEHYRAEFIKRAYVAYWRSGGGEEPRANWSYTDAASDKTYVILANFRRIVAVFRRLDGGTIKRLRRWPKSLVALPEGKRTF